MKRTILIAALVVAILAIGYVIADRALNDRIESRAIDENGLHANFYAQENDQLKPTIILIGGGEWGNYWGQTFAKRGYMALSLPYYRREGLPELPEEIPLEYIEKAIDWLKDDPSILPRRIILMGASRNAELALMAAVTFPKKVNGVIAYAPGSVHWSNTVMPFNSDEVKSSWTLNGEAIPYIAMEKYAIGESGKVDFISYWEKGLSDSAAVAEASIQVENIGGPVFLFSGKDDQVWPSARMGDMIEQRLETYGFEYPIHNVQYDDAGHQISGNPDSQSDRRMGQMYLNGISYEYAFGGTAEGDLYAQQDAKRRIFEYLETIVNADPIPRGDQHQYFNDLKALDIEKGLDSLKNVIASADRVVAYNWNGREDNPANTLDYVADAYGTFTDRLGKNFDLDKSQIKALGSILTDTAHYNGYNSMCFIPHIAFVYIKDDSIIGQSNVCFMCSGVKSIPKSTQALSDAGVVKLKAFCKEVGLEIVDSVRY